jgi:hypothetical protein
VALSGVALTHTNANTLTSCATSLAIGATTTCTATHVTTASEANDGVIDIVSVSGTWNTSTAIAVSSLTVPAAQPCTVTSATSEGIATPTSVGRVGSNSDGKKDMLLSDVQITITTSGACTGLRVKYFPKTPSSVVADMTESSPGVWLAVIPGENSDGAAKWSAGTKQVQVLPASTVGNTAIYTNTAAFTVT